MASPSDNPSRKMLYTASNGTPVRHPYEVQRMGDNGPLLLQDFHLIDLLSHFDRERIPERVVHAKGGGAHGYFRTTNPLDDLCLSDLFSTKGRECPVTVRFSTVGGESGSHDHARDPRGFAIKFRTSEGNWDLVQNNTPVFFIRDPAKFPHLIHTQKRDPASHLTGADDSTMFWDYFSQNPESVHQVMYTFGDRGIPENWRRMHGYSGHTLKLVNESGSWVYCQIHVKSHQGAGFLTSEDAARRSPDANQRDLYEAIQRTEFPSWDLCVQTMTSAEAEVLWQTQKINVLDLTHCWPQAQFPLRKVGELCLNQNAENYFAEIEQVAFNPAHMPPGILPSDDPVLQSRLFSYPDAHRHRLGPNYQQLPVNAPRCPITNFQRDGPSAYYNQGARPNYLASSAPLSFPNPTAETLYPHGSTIGGPTPFLSTILPSDFNQPRQLWTRVFDNAARDRFVDNVAGHLANCRDEEVIKRQLGIFREVSEELAGRLEDRLGVKGYDSLVGVEFLGCGNGLGERGSTVRNGAPGTSQ